MSSRPSTALRTSALIVAAAVAFGVLAAIATSLLPRSFEASATVLIGRSTAASDPDYQDLLASQLLAQTYSELATTRPVLEAVAKELGVQDSPEALASMISAQASGATPIVRITVRGPADRTVAIANSVAHQLVAWKGNQSAPPVQPLSTLQSSIALIDAQIERAQSEASDRQSGHPSGAAPNPALEPALSRLASLLSTRASLLQLFASISTTSVQVIEPADTAHDGIRQALILNVGAGAILGGLAAAAVVFANSGRRRLVLDE